jgi:hypothetical protein
MERRGGAAGLSLVEPLHTAALGLAYIQKLSSAPAPRKASLLTSSL